MSVPSLNVVIHSRDMRRALSFYATLGFAFVLDKHGDDGPEHYACELGGAVLEIYPWKKKPDPAFLSSSSIRLTLEVDGLVPLLDLLRPLARRIDDSRARRDDGPRCARIIDPDGNQLLLIERATASLH